MCSWVWFNPKTFSKKIATHPDIAHPRQSPATPIMKGIPWNRLLVYGFLGCVPNRSVCWWPTLDFCHAKSQASLKPSWATRRCKGGKCFWWFTWREKRILEIWYIYICKIRIICILWFLRVYNMYIICIAENHIIYIHQKTSSDLRIAESSSNIAPLIYIQQLTLLHQRLLVLWTLIHYPAGTFPSFQAATFP